MTTEQTIPLNLLVASKANVRRTGKSEGIGELAASIAAHGLRQNLNVLPSGAGRRYEVVAGGRRLRALKQLAKEGTLAKDAPIPCMVLAEHDDPAEISLVENAVRSAMHPDDQFEAFRALIEEKGVSVEDVAARFGVTPTVVRQRLKLANVSPKLRTLYRKGEMGLDHVMALAISDDHAAQEEAWRTLPDWNRDPGTLKRALTHDTVPMTDRLAKFVGMEAYVAAGGAVLRDLFDDQHAGYLSDRALLTRLADERMEVVLAGLRAEGWKWAKAEFSRDYGTCYGRVYPQRDAADAEAAPVFTAEAKAQAGARMILEHDGTLGIERGLVHPDDVKAEARRARGETTGAASPAGLSAAMVEDLTAHRTAALRIELARNPAVALAATVHAMALSLRYGSGLGTCLTLRASSEALERHTQAVDDSPAHQAMTAEGERWGDQLPGKPSDLFAWCLAQPQETLLDLLAYLTALTVDAVQVKHGPRGGQAHADQLAEAVSLDMRQWWTPTVEGFFQRLPKAMLVSAVTEAGVTAPAPFDSVRKAEAAKMAAKALAGSGWLPAPLKGHAPTLAT